MTGDPKVWSGSSAPVDRRFLLIRSTANTPVDEARLLGINDLVGFDATHAG